MYTIYVYYWNEPLQILPGYSNYADARADAKAFENQQGVICARIQAS